MPQPAMIGLSGGIPMRFFNGNNASVEGEAYVVSMLHQLHCIVSRHPQCTVLNIWLIPDLVGGAETRLHGIRKDTNDSYT